MVVSSFKVAGKGTAEQASGARTQKLRRQMYLATLRVKSALQNFSAIWASYDLQSSCDSSCGAGVTCVTSSRRFLGARVSS